VSERDLKHTVSRFFTEHSLPAPRASRLSALAAATDESSRRAASPRWAAFAGMLAACVIVTAFVTARLVSPDQGAQGTVADASRQGTQEIESATGENGECRTPRLVAVSTRADWCPMCPRMTPVYKKLMEDYGERSVLFVVFDMTDDAAKKQTEYLASTLGIEWLCKQKMPTGSINLVDREKGVVLASVTQPDQMDELIGSLDKALK